MKKPTYNHTNALSHAIRLLQTAVRRYGEDQMVKELRKDISRLKEVREMIQFNITHPTLPFGEPKQPPMFNKLIDAVCEVG